MSAKHWIASEDEAEFREFCESNGHATRDHTDPFRRGFQVQHKGHWMGVVWNGAFKRYSADSRLSLIVQSWASHRARTQGGA
ncbi:hypothetical protein V8Z80_08275 [Orrella sp. JC864]|uniref:hypothetical protein n=1 Tax=Orrella sp. JC864 TaxID=3120298 RepID=UPI00300AA713